MAFTMIIYLLDMSLVQHFKHTVFSSLEKTSLDHFNCHSFFSASGTLYHLNHIYVI